MVRGSRLTRPGPLAAFGASPARSQEVEARNGPVIASRRAAEPLRRHDRRVFLFFSNRFGCLGSVLISLALTLLLFFVFVR